MFLSAANNCGLFFAGALVKIFNLKLLSMKKVILLFASVVTLSAMVKAQQGNNQIGIAAEAALPIGDFADSYKTGVGGSLKGLFGIGQSGQITFTTGYTSFKADESTDDFKITATIIPLLAGYRHNFTGGVYVEPQLGYGIYGSKVEIMNEDETDSEGAFTYAIGVGFAASGFDAGIRYQGASKDGNNTSFVGVRVGYNFTLGGSSASK
jgi:hypothetical protein